MQNHRIGFISSWRALTSERGWYKPLIILALLSWVPILGTIALLGYAYEWARLAAWGVDGAPRRQGIDYGKLLATGGWAFLILLSMSIVCSVIESILFGTGFTVLMPLDFGSVGSWGASVDEYRYVAFGMRELVAAVCQVIAGGFILAAMMRGVIYDGFSAGWRLDRLFQMIGRDMGGFMRLVAVSAIGCAVGLAYSWLATIVVSFAASAGFTALGWHDGALYLFNTGYLLRHLFTLEPSMALGAALLSAAVSFIGSMLSIAMQMVSVHATGMWFRSFDVGRWGLSSDPLPDDVPHPLA